MRWTVGVGSVALVAALGCTGGGGGTAVTLDLGFRGNKMVACEERGDAVACAELAHDYHHGGSGDVNLPAARAYYRKGCDGGVPKACGRLGYMLEFGEGGPADSVAALPLHLRACDGRYAEGCNNAAVLLLAQEPTDWKRVHELARLGCDLGVGDSCALLAVSYSTGRGLAKDSSGAVRYLERACELGHPESCAVAADAYARGVGVAVDERRTAELLGRGCELGDPKACP